MKSKLRLVGTKLTSVPVPVSDTVCGLPLALSATESEPVRVPVAVGLKVTLIVQLAPAATLVPQVLVSEKSPVVEMLVMLRVAVPVLVSVTVSAALLVPSTVTGKVRLVGESVTAGAPLVTVCVTDEPVCGL